MRNEQHADPWTLLGVPRHADAGAIKRAYRRKALHLHPDRDPSPGAAERFRRSHQAYLHALQAPPSRQPHNSPPAAAPRPRSVVHDRPATRRERLIFRALHLTGLCFSLGLLAGVALGFLFERALSLQLMLALPGLAILPDSLAGLRPATTKAGA